MPNPDLESQPKKVHQEDTTMTDLTWESEYGECQRAEIETSAGEVHALIIVPVDKLENDGEASTGFSLVVSNVTRGRKGRCIVRNGGFHYVRKKAEYYARLADSQK